MNELTDDQIESIKARLHHISLLLRPIISSAQPDVAVAILSGFLGSTTGMLPDRLWESMRESCVACGNPDCDCHTQKKALLEAIHPIREDWKKA